jgi:hypothetical protein
MLSTALEDRLRGRGPVRDGSVQCCTQRPHPGRRIDGSQETEMKLSQETE